MPQEQYTHHRSTMPSSEGPQVYKVGIYGWRKRCLYFFVLLLMILILVNLAMTIWILKVMNFTIDGMGNLRITEKGLKLEGDSEFLQPLYAKEIRSRPGNALYFKSARNVTVNILNDQTKVLTQLITGPKAVEAYGKKFEVKTVSGKLLFSADENEVVVGAERLRVLVPNSQWPGLFCVEVLPIISTSLPATELIVPPPNSPPPTLPEFFFAVPPFS
ncbi:delta-sarcoglycan [Trichechus manatus latirostris]|uniref:Delta-sarcoglycan n=1 Tax=Trichechus manatus latirostris TaxID=127582 RepID=A0A2Y9QS62_TRIMA|nr:delta-sarcoglycan [Trichechus manatus latirostris]